MTSAFGRPEGPPLRSPVGGAASDPGPAAAYSAPVPQSMFGGLVAGDNGAPPQAYGIPTQVPGGATGQIVTLGGAGPTTAPRQEQPRSRVHPHPRPETPQEAAAREAWSASDITAPLGGVGLTTPPTSDVRTAIAFPQGHPSAAQRLPFQGPGHSMPINAGMLPGNFVGNLQNGLGVWANAPRPVTAYQGQPFPTGVPGTYVPNVGSAPVAAAFGGFPGGFHGADERDQRRAQREAEANQRVVNLGDGYIYQQFSDGRIVVLKSADPGRLPHGTVLKPGERRWQAVTGEIGSWASYVQQRRAGVASSVAQGLTAGAQIVGAFTGGRGRGRGKGRGRGRRGQQVPVAPLPELPVEEPSSGLPSWAPIAGIAVVGGLILLSMSGGGGKGR